MKTYKLHSSSVLGIAVLAIFMFAPIVGCSDSTTAPSVDNNHTYTSVVEKQFTVDPAAVIDVDDFTGEITYRIGQPGVVRVVATRWSAFKANLDSIDVSMSGDAAGVTVQTNNPTSVKKAGVDFEITAPASALPQLHTAVGAIKYRGRPVGSCRFETGVGEIRLELPDDVSIAVDLSAGVGSIFSAFPIDGSVSTEPAEAHGTIGGGNEGYVYAATSVGNIHLIRW